MKVLDKYILKSFLQPFFATFLIVLFVLIMQALWQTFDQIAGKGISIGFLLKFLYYTTLIMIPQALPIGVLLSSIMALGNFGENYEFAAAKSAGVSLQRLVRPLVFLAFFTSALNFLFLNNVYPYAILKQRNLYNNIKKKKPALALVPGSFNSEIPNYQIKFDEKYGKEKNLLKNVLIYDLSSGKGKQKVITAERGKIVSEEGSRYMTLILYDGYYYENHKTRSRANMNKNMPASNATFEEYEFNIDISSLSEGDLDDEKFKNSYNMLSVQQLNDTIPIMKINYDEFINLRAKNIYSTLAINKLYKYPDSLQINDAEIGILDNYNLANKITILNASISNAKQRINYFKNNKRLFKIKRKILNQYDTEYYNRFAFSLSCLLLFFIGAPLGSIIRKGGFGTPMITAVIIYVVFHFIGVLSRGMADTSEIPPWVGGWLPTMIMFPFGIFLNFRAIKDKSVFNLDGIITPITNIIKSTFKK